MGLLIGLIVNAVLLSIPIGGTLGTLFGIRPFRNEIVPLPRDFNHVLATSACNEFHEFAQNKMGLNFTGELWVTIPLSFWLGRFGIISYIYIIMHIFCLPWTQN